LSFQNDPNTILWRLHLSSPPERVYRLLATGEGRARFWAESAEEIDGHIHFIFPGGEKWQGKILEKEPPKRFSVVYFGGSHVTFDLTDDGKGGTDLTLTDSGVHPTDRSEVVAGWVSVLMALKGAADFGVDLRNHDPDRSWKAGYMDN
jgi:uncharacterized protein YndB with AHSA1/START domain